MFTKIKAKFNYFLIIFVIFLMGIWQGFNFFQSPNLPILKIGINDWPGYAIAYYGQETGIFEKRGIKVEFITFNSLQDSVRATLKGSLDATFSTLWGLMQADIAQEKPVLLMVTNISFGSDGIVAQNDIKTVEDLKGKKVGAQLGTVNHLILLEALQLHNLKPDDVIIESILNEVAVKRMRVDSLDAAVLWQPLLKEIAKSINGNIIYTTKEVESLVIDVLASRKSFVINNEEILEKFMLAWFDIMKKLENNPDEVFQIVSKKIGQTKESFTNDYSGLKTGDIMLNKKMFSGDLQKAQNEIIKLLKSDLRHSRTIRNDLEINQKIIKKVLQKWKPN